MKALSINQPFASLIAQGDKRTEHRSWQTAYRGTLIICATAKPVITIEKELLPYRVALCTVFLASIKKIKNGFSWQLKSPRPILPVFVNGAQHIFNLNIKLEFLPQNCDHITLFNDLLSKKLIR